MMTAHTFGKSLGKSEKELAQYKKNAMNYKNEADKRDQFDAAATKMVNSRHRFGPLKWGDAFTEGNSWHYSWSVFHDPQGLINLMGGKDTLRQHARSDVQRLHPDHTQLLWWRDSRNPRCRS